MYDLHCLLLGVKKVVVSAPLKEDVLNVVQLPLLPLLYLLPLLFQLPLLSLLLLPPYYEDIEFYSNSMGCSLLNAISPPLLYSCSGYGG